MIDSLVKQLNSHDPEQRKKAIKGLAQTKDPSALKYLAAVAKNDADPEVRDLALKAGRYIKKQGGTQTEARPMTPAYAEEEPAEEEAQPEEVAGVEEPLPDQIEVSQADMDRAKGFVQQALNWHMHEDNDKAAQALSKAFRANPKLRYDSYSMGLAATVTGLSPDEAVERLSPSPEELRRRTKPTTGGRGVAVSSGQRLVAFLFFIGAAVLLVSFLTFPWVDFSSMPTKGLKGEDTTFGQALTDLKQFFTDTVNAAQKSGNAGASPVPLDQLVSAINALKIDFTGLDTMSLVLGMRNILDVMGFTTFFNLAHQPMPPVTLQTTEPLDYTLILIPIVGVIAILLGLVLLVRSRVSLSLWVTCIIVGGIGMVPFWYFFTQARQSLLADSANLQGVVGTAIPADFTGLNFIAYGYWVSLGAQLAILLLPFIALLLQPSADKATNEGA
jgi:hypothetical protein